jgi:hypothetical protein
LAYASKFGQPVLSLLAGWNEERLVAGDPVRWLSPTTKRQFEQAAFKEGTLDREHSVLGRVEQSYLRHGLFGDAEDATCSLCGRRWPVGLLVAAHIKK